MGDMERITHFRAIAGDTVAPRTVHGRQRSARTHAGPALALRIAARSCHEERGRLRPFRRHRARRPPPRSRWNSRGTPCTAIGGHPRHGAAQAEPGTANRSITRRRCAPGSAPPAATGRYRLERVSTGQVDQRRKRVEAVPLRPAPRGAGVRHRRSAKAGRDFEELINTFFDRRRSNNHSSNWVSSRWLLR